MYIINYNSTKHDIYTFESGMTLISTSFIPEVGQPYVDDYPLCTNCGNCTLPSTYDRKQASPMGYNDLGLWKINPPGGIIPNWNGLHTRERGSSINTCSVPWHTYILRNRPSFNRGTLQDDKYSPLNHINWNNEIPAAVVISPRHFLSTTHFHSESVGCNQETHICPEDLTREYTIKLPNEEGGFFTKSAHKLGSNYDITVFKFDTDLTDDQVDFIKPYKIVDSSTLPAGTIMWKQNPNGTFVVGYLHIPAYYTIVDDSELLVLPDAPGDVQGNGNNMVRSFHEIDNTYPDYTQDIWMGHSGSPVLVTANNETYLFQLANGGGHVSILYQYLYDLCLADGVTLPDLVDLGHRPVLVNFASSLSIPPYNSRFIN